MPIRMTGLISGLDTESVIKELMSAHNLKKTKVEQKKTKEEWKQDKWKELNTKLYALYSKQASKMKLQSSYMTKKVTSSNENVLTATANVSSATGSHTIQVNKLASAQYVTGSTNDDLKDATASTKLTDLGMTAGTIITVTVGEKSSSMTVTDSSKISDFVTYLQNAGLNASFDTEQNRFFISSKESGKANAFSITTSAIAEGSDLANARTELENVLGSNASALDTFYNNYGTALEELEAKQAAYDAATGDERLTAWEELQTAKEAVQKLEDDLVSLATTATEQTETAKAAAAVAESYVAKLKEAAANAETDETVKESDEYKAYAEALESVNKSYYKTDDDGNLVEGEFSDTALENAKAAYKAEAKKAIEEEIANGTEYASTAEKEAAIEAKYQELLTANGGEEAALNAKAQELYDNSLTTALNAKGTAYAATEEGQQEVADLMEDADESNGSSAAVTAAGEAVKAAISKYAEALKNEDESGSISVTSGQLSGLGLADITVDDDGKATTSGGTVSFVAAEDAEIVLDGATLTGTSNTFTAAGITFDLKGTTAGSSVTLNVSNDIDAVYDSIKEFFKEYNSILEEMNTLYNADSARGYDPLTDEEKEAMTEDQVELWETKIKDSLLRRDSTLGSLMSAMKTAMQSTVTVDGKNYSLSSFGIMTSTDYTEGGLLHIYGDEDDATYASQTDKLKAALASDPETVTKVLTGIIGKLSDTMMDKMKKTSLSSALTFYNDIQIKNNISDYEDQIDKWEDRLEEIENRYYDQFTAMEKAMATLQSQSSYLSNLMGTS